MSRHTTATIRQGNILDRRKMVGCPSGKTSYKSYTHANEALTRIQQLDSKKRQEKRIYHCPKCSKYHLTSQDDKRIKNNKKEVHPPVRFNNVKTNTKSTPPSRSTKTYIDQHKILYILKEFLNIFSDDEDAYQRVYNARADFKQFRRQSTPETLNTINEVLLILNIDKLQKDFQEEFLNKQVHDLAA